MRKATLVLAVCGLLTVASAVAVENPVEVRSYGHAFVLITSPAEDNGKSRSLRSEEATSAKRE